MKTERTNSEKIPVIAHRRRIGTDRGFLLYETTLLARSSGNYRLCARFVTTSDPAASRLNDFWEALAFHWIEAKADAKRSKRAIAKAVFEIRPEPAAKRDGKKSIVRVLSRVVFRNGAAITRKTRVRYDPENFTLC